MKRFFIFGISLFTLLLWNTHALQAQDKPLSEQLAATVLDNSPVGSSEQGLILGGLDAVWKRTGNADYFNTMKKSLDFLDTEAAELENLQYGRTLLTLYQVTGQDQYFKAATLMWTQLHQQINSEQVWPDGLYWGQPFYAKYAALTQDQAALNNIAQQLINMEKQSHRAMGWYGLAVVDVLDDFPKDQAKRNLLIGILERFAAAVAKQQQAKNGLWQEWATAEKFVYTLAKGVRKGYLPEKYLRIAEKGYAGLQKAFTEKGAKFAQGKDMGAFLLATTEMELAALPKPVQGKVVLLDSYFNNEVQKNQSGHEVSWHYKWPDLDNNGFSKWGGLLESKGFNLSTAYEAPTVDLLNEAAVYIIVDPDTKKETLEPKFIGANDVEVIANWVKAGGILVLMGNDAGNAELDHFNKLTQQFGITFNKDTKGRVTGNEFEMGAVAVPAGTPIFKKSRKLFIKEYSSLTLEGPASPVLKDKEGNVVIAVAPYVKGKVFVIGDPWLYNEYIDGRKLPGSFDNFKAADELSQWLAEQVL
jgi:unsaturated rhamnogalacturonyl hydrolase